MESLSGMFIWKMYLESLSEKFIWKVNWKVNWEVYLKSLSGKLVVES